MSMSFIRIRYAKNRIVTLFGRLLLISIMLCCSAVWEQDLAADEKNGISTGLVVEIESELHKAEQDMVLWIEQLEDLQFVKQKLQKAIETNQAALAETESSSDSSRQKAALEKLQVRQEDMAVLTRKIRTVQLLYDQAVEYYRIAGERRQLYRVREKTGSAEQGGTLISDTAHRKAEVKHVVDELELAQREVAVLEQKLSILTDLAEILSQETMDAEQRLREDNLSDAARRSIELRRRNMRDEQHNIESLIVETRKKLLRARTQRHVLTEKARQKATGLTRWQTDIVKSVVMIALVVLLLVVVRILIGSHIKDAQRRYYLNRSLSILTVFVVLVGLLVIFVRDLAYLFTGLGVAVAGLAIALQEIITSFFAWFLIQGSRGYRVRDWIRIGDQSGEVLDVSLILTTLGQVTAIDPRGESGGGWTGGLTIFPNSTIFKQPIVNFTRGYPFIWCSLRYTFTYESDWKQAETILLDVVKDNEIVAAAQQARKKIEEMTKDFAIRVRNTDPVVRSRAAGSGVELILRFLTHPRRRRLLMDKVNRLILEAVNLSDHVDFAYRTIRTIPTPPDEA